MWWNLNNHWVAQWQPANPRCGTSSYQASLKIHNIYKYITKSRNFYLYFLRKPVELQMPLHCHVSREVRELHLKVVDLAFWWKSFQQYLDQFLGVDWPVPVPRDNIIMIFQFSAHAGSLEVQAKFKCHSLGTRGGLQIHYLQVPTGLGRTTPAVYTAWDDTVIQMIVIKIDKEQHFWTGNKKTRVSGTPFPSPPGICPSGWLSL